MSFFDDLSKSIDKTGRTIASKASGIVDSTKLSHQISQEERAMDEVYRQIGIAYFSLYGNAPAEQLAPMCDEIRRKWSCWPPCVSRSSPPEASACARIAAANAICISPTATAATLRCPM